MLSLLTTLQHRSIGLIFLEMVLATLVRSVRVIISIFAQNFIIALPKMIYWVVRTLMLAIMIQMPHQTMAVVLDILIMEIILLVLMVLMIIHEQLGQII